jgi:nickel-dependent lactate racemase
MHSGAGAIASILYNKLTAREPGVSVGLMPALGTHAPMTDAETGAFFPGVPRNRILTHRWRQDVVSLGQVPAEFVKQVSEGLMDEPFEVEINRRLLESPLIFSIGQVVPHEVVGMANYTKNILVGVGGSA